MARKRKLSSMHTWAKKLRRRYEGYEEPDLKRSISVQSKVFSHYIHVKPLSVVSCDLEESPPQLDKQHLIRLSPDEVLHILQFILPTLEIRRESVSGFLLPDMCGTLEISLPSVKDLFARYKNGDARAFKRAFQIHQDALLEYKWLFSIATSIELIEVDDTGMKILDDMTNSELDAVRTITHNMQSSDDQLTLRVLSKCKNLWSYSLSKRTRGERSVDALAIGLAKIPHLKRIGLLGSYRFEGSFYSSGWKIQWKTLLDMINIRSDYISLKVELPMSSHCTIPELIPEIAKLQSLEIFHIYAVMTPEIVNAISDLSKLQKLRINFDYESSCYAFKDDHKLVNVRKLTLEGHAPILTPHWITVQRPEDRLAVLRRFTSLKHLKIVGIEDYQGTLTRPLVRYLSPIETLELRHCCVPVTILDDLKECSHLKKLVIIEKEDIADEDEDATIWKLLDHADVALDECRDEMELIVATSCK